MAKALENTVDNNLNNLYLTAVTYAF